MRIVYKLDLTAEETDMLKKNLGRYFIEFSDMVKDYKTGDYHMIYRLAKENEES